MEAILGLVTGFVVMGVIVYFVIKPNSKPCNHDQGIIPDKDSVRWINATHAILSTINHKSTQIYGGVIDRQARIQDEKESLVDSWEIYDTTSLLETVDWLMKKGGHRVRYEGPAHEIAAWDYSRALSLLSSAYLIGYLSREEALDRSLPIAKLCQQEYDSWDDFMAAYFKGYRFWSGRSSIDRERIYQMLKKRKNNVYSLPWNLSLVKEW